MRLIAIYITLLMDFNKIVRALGVVTPFLIVFVVIIAIYYLFNGSVALNEVNSTVHGVTTPKALTILLKSISSVI